jgi:deoxyribonuclease V
MGSLSRIAWPDTPAEARRLQERLRKEVVAEDRFGPVRRLAGVDVHYAPVAGLTWAAVAVLSFPDLELEESALACRPTTFPYVPGLLAFREAPPMLDALARVSRPPDLILVNGHGLAHPRRFGLACHVGVLTGIPVIGVAMSRLVGAYREPGPKRGEWSQLIDRGETVGAVLRTRSRVRPVFVSPGHLVSLTSAIAFVLACAPRFRVPEPLRLADRLSRLHPP